MNKIVICGYGDVGKAIFKILERNENNNVYIHDPDQGRVCIAKDFDYLIVCFPYYIESVFNYDLNTYIKEFNPKAVIIHSTIPPTHMFDENIPLSLHIPVRGTHPNMYEDILKNYVWMVGQINPKAIDIDGIMSDVYHKSKCWDDGYRIFDSWKEAALAKLINTTWYAMQIGFANQIKEVCNKENINFDQAYTICMETDTIGRKYIPSDLKDDCGIRKKCEEKIPRPVMIPGNFGGKCLRPNLKLLEPLAPEFVKELERLDDLMEEKKC